MRLKRICRIESYPNRTKYGYNMTCDWNDVYFLDLRYNRKQWFDDDYDPIDNPLVGYNTKEFYKTVNEIWKMEEYRKSGCYVEKEQEEEFDIMFEDESVFPYEDWSGNDVYEEIDKSYWRNFKKIGHLIKG